MSALIEPDRSGNFYCPRCRMTFGLAQADITATGGVPHCPVCRWHRTDGFSQRGPNEVTCNGCGARIGVLPTETPACPNC